MLLLHHGNALRGGGGFSLILLLLLLLVASALCNAQKNCQHGLTANDIAANSGLDLTGKVALVTGGRSGLGYAISEALLRQGCTVVIASRNEPLNEQAVADLKSTVTGADVSYIPLDLESFEKTRTFATNFLANHSRLDYYFANAGQANQGAQPLTVDGYERVFQVDYVAQVLLLELLLPLLRQTQPSSRVLLTASSTHTLACGALQLKPEDQCWGDGTAVAKLPFDQAGLDAIDSTFHCFPTNGTYPVTKYLMTQLARETTKREAEAGNPVYAYSWAPGNINTNLNPVAFCCVGPIDTTDGDSCRFQLPYVGPVDDAGNPNPPSPPEQNQWTTPAHGAMAAVFAALSADVTDAGSWFATYWECEPEVGYFPQGITPAARAEIYDLSLSWAGVTTSSNSTDQTDASSPNDAAPPSSTQTSGSSSGLSYSMSTIFALPSLAIGMMMVLVLG